MSDQHEHVGAGTDEDELRVSVIIPCYNVAETIVPQLEALASQVSPPRFETILVLNGCTDSSEEVIRAFAQAHPGMRIRLEESAKGRCIARNHGAKVARAEIICFLDADDIAEPDWLRELHSRIQDVGGIVGGRLLHTKVNPPELLEVYGIDRNEPHPYTLPDLPPDDFSVLREVVENNFGTRRADYLCVGGMDSSFTGGLEGTDFCLRAQALGIPVNSCTRALVNYRLRETVRGTFRQQRALARSKLLFFVRHFHTGRSAGASFKYSLGNSLLHVLRLPLALLDRDQVRKHRFFHALGGHLGSLEGHILYRILRRVPEPDFMTVAPAQLAEH